MGEAVESLLRRIGVQGDPPDSEVDAQGRLYLYLAATGPCSIGHGGHNWVSENGGLPNYICHIAKAIMRGGKMDESHAIATAVGTAKKWAAGVHGGVSEHGASKPEKAHAQTQARAAEAVSEWEALKARAHAKGVGKHLTHGLENGKSHDEASKDAEK